MLDDEQRKSLPARASIYYSAASYYISRGLLLHPLLFLKGISYLCVAREAALRAIVCNGLSADELDVLQSVFRKSSLMPMCGQDINLAACALTRAQPLPKDAHTDALLALGHLELAMRTCDDKEHIKRLYHCAYHKYQVVLGLLMKQGFFKAPKGEEPEELSDETRQLARQAARIARNLGRFAITLGSMTEAHEHISSAAMFRRVVG
jgi:hypothetical protein